MSDRANQTNESVDDLSSIIDELVWNYWVNNYIMGRQPPPLDVLYWDNDSTRLPAKLHGDFLDMHEFDVFRKPHTQTLFGVPIDYSKVRVDTYFVGGIDDYLMPWKAVYQVARTFRGKHRFVLSDSGHVQSVLRPPHLARTEYFTNAASPETPEQWLATSTRHEGTWWHDWTRWLSDNSGACKNAPRRTGSRDFPAIRKAPGEYVRQRI